MMRRVGLIMVALLAGASVPAAAQRWHAAEAPAPPTGWIGLLLQFYQAPPGEEISYPTVLSVEGNSPASKAGFVVGDTILSYDRVDARNDPEGLVKLLVPNRKIAFRVRRNGVHTAKVTVGKRQTVFIYMGDKQVELAPRQPDRAPEGVSFFQFTVAPEPVAIVAPLAARADVPVVGASLTRMNAGLATALRIANAGMLVIDVAAETPAAASGVQEGDVIVSADGMATNTVHAILQAIQAKTVKGEKSVGLEVLRKGKKQKVALKW
jgi:S1-C subfamily serine protease